MPVKNQETYFSINRGRQTLINYWRPALRFSRNIRKVIRTNIRKGNNRKNRKQTSPRKYRKGDGIYFKVTNIKPKTRQYIGRKL